MKKLIIILFSIMAILGTANAGVLQDVAGILQYDSVNVCLADGSQTFDEINFVSHTGNTNESINRSFHLNEQKILSVCTSGCDYTTIQEAVNTIPFFINYDYKIEVQAGTYNEDVLIPFFISTHTNPNEGDESSNLIIEGNITNPISVKVNSFTFDGGYGTIQLNGFSILTSNPYDNELSGIGAYDSSEIGFNKITFEESNATTGILCYNSKCRANGIELGINKLDNGVKVKHGSNFWFDNFNYGYGINGTAVNYVYNVADGQITFNGEDNATGGVDLVFDTSNGFAYDSNSGKLWGVKEFENRIGDFLLRKEDNLDVNEEGAHLIANSNNTQRLAGIGIRNNNDFETGLKIKGDNSDNTASEIEFYSDDNLRATMNYLGTWDFKSKDITEIGIINLGSPQELTISSGDITITNSYHTVDTESNSASDDLDCVSGGTEGDLLYLFGQSGSRDVTFKYNSCGVSANRLLIQGGVDLVTSNEAEGLNCIKRSFGWQCSIIGES